MASHISLLAGPGYAVYTNGLIGPFTGAHDALISTSTTAVQGDILVDVSVIARRGLSDVITLVALSSVPNDKAAVGIYSMEVPDLVPTAMSNI